MMKGIRLIVLLGLLCVMQDVSAYENSSMTDEYRELLDGSPISAVMHTFVTAFGGGAKGQIAYAIMIIMFYSMVFMSTRDMMPSNFLLSMALYVYYNYIPAISWPVFFFLIVFGVLSTLWRGYSSYNASG